MNNYIKTLSLVVLTFGTLNCASIRQTSHLIDKINGDKTLTYLIPMQKYGIILTFLSGIVTLSNLWNTLEAPDNSDERAQAKKNTIIAGTITLASGIIAAALQYKITAAIGKFEHFLGLDRKPAWMS